MVRWNHVRTGSSRTWYCIGYRNNKWWICAIPGNHDRCLSLEFKTKYHRNRHKDESGANVLSDVFRGSQWYISWLVVDLFMREWRRILIKIWLNSGSGNGLMLHGIKTLPEPMLTYHQRWSVTFASDEYHQKCSWTQIAKLMGPTWGPSRSCRPQVGPINLATREGNPKHVFNDYSLKTTSTFPS